MQEQRGRVLEEGDVEREQTYHAAMVSEPQRASDGFAAALYPLALADRLPPLPRLARPPPAAPSNAATPPSWVRSPGFAELLLLPCVARGAVLALPSPTDNAVLLDGGGD